LDVGSRDERILLNFIDHSAQTYFPRRSNKIGFETEPERSLCILIFDFVNR